MASRFLHDYIAMIRTRCLTRFHFFLAASPLLVVGILELMSGVDGGRFIVALSLLALGTCTLAWAILRPPQEKCKCAKRPSSPRMIRVGIILQGSAILLGWMMGVIERARVEFGSLALAFVLVGIALLIYGDSGRTTNSRDSVVKQSDG